MLYAETRQSAQKGEIESHDDILMGKGKQLGLVARVSFLEWLALGCFIAFVILLVISIIILIRVF